MSSPCDPSDELLVEGDHSQLWVRQRRLQAKSNSVSADDATCTCRSAASQGPPSPSHTINSTELLGGRREVQIVHGGEIYRLLVTRNNKLILQK